MRILNATCLAFACAGLLASCGETSPAGAAELADVCRSKLGGSVETCACYSEKLEASLDPDLFERVARSAFANRKFSGPDWIPNSLRSDPRVSAAMSSAREACFG